MYQWYNPWKDSRDKQDLGTNIPKLLPKIFPHDWIHVNTYDTIVCAECAPNYLYDLFEKEKNKTLYCDKWERKHVLENYERSKEYHMTDKINGAVCIGCSYIFCKKELLDRVIRRIETEPIVKDIIE